MNISSDSISDTFFIPDHKFSHTQLEMLQKYLIDQNDYHNFALLLSEYLSHEDSKLFVSFRMSQCSSGRSCLMLTDPPLRNQDCKIGSKSWWLLIATANPVYDFHKFRADMCFRMDKLVQFKTLQFRMYPHRIYKNKQIGIGCGFRGLNATEQKNYYSWTKKYATVLGTLQRYSERIVRDCTAQDFQAENQRILN